MEVKEPKEKVTLRYKEKLNMDIDIVKNRMTQNFWYMKTMIPITLWNELRGRGIVKNNLDEFVTEAILEKLERDS